MLPWRECLKQQSPGDAWAGQGASQENSPSNSRFSSTSALGHSFMGENLQANARFALQMAYDRE
jgi:hypothetical protein